MIKNLLFDLGGVIMDIRRQNCVEAFKRLGMEHPEDLLGEYQQAGVFGDVESGKIDEAGFYEAIRQYLPAGVTDEQIRSAFNDFLVGIPAQRLKALEKLHGLYKIYLISNTNPIMWRTRIADEFRKDGHDIDYYFDGIVTSFEAKSMKPEREIFDQLTERYGIKPAETLFFDDSRANVEAAKQLGFRAVEVEPGTEFYNAVALGI